MVSNSDTPNGKPSVHANAGIPTNYGALGTLVSVFFFLGFVDLKKTK